MGLFGKESATADEQKPLKSSKYGPLDLEDRRCTDVFCLVMFILSLITLLTVSIVVYVRGDINDIRYGVDYMGHRCGTGVNHGKDKLWYPRIAQDANEQAIVMSTRPWDVVLYGFCVPSCPIFDPSKFEDITDPGYGHDPHAKAAKWPVGVSTLDMINRCYPDPESVSTTQDLCATPNCTTVGAPCFTAVPGVPSGTWQIAHGYPESLCTAKLHIETSITREQANSGSYLDSVFSTVATAKDVWESLVDNWWIIVLFGVVATTLLNSVWLVVLYLFAGAAVWMCILLITLLLTVGMMLAYIKAGVGEGLVNDVLNTTQAEAVMEGTAGGTINSFLSASDSDDRWLWWIAAIISSVLVLLWVIFLCCSRKAIGRCIVLIREATIALRTSWGLACLPWFIVSLQILVVGFGLLTLAVLTTFDMNGTYADHIKTLGDAYVNTVSSDADFLAANITGHQTLIAGLTTSQQQYALGSIIGFGMVWLYAFLTTVGLMTIAACVFFFYYVNKSTVPETAYMKQYDDNQTRWPVIKHLGWVLRYHVGSMALGSFIVAVVTVIQIVTRGIFEYMQKNSGSSQTIKIVAACVDCCLACFKKTIEFINSYAYIYVFVENVSFCTGAAHTFQLMLKYPAQIAINTTVQRVLGLLQLLLVPGGCTLMAYTYFNFSDSHTATGGLMLTGTVLVCSLLMTRAFSSVFEQVIQSLTVCVLHDVDSFDGRFLRQSMKEAFGDPKKA